MSWQGVIEQYRRYLPVNEQTKVVTLLEGNTPLIPVPRFVDAIGGRFELYVKLEALNPTGSFKDRGMTMAMTAAKTRGAGVVVCASTGNTSASAAAYAARAGLRAAVVLPHGKIAMGKLAQALIYGARIVPIDGNFDDALNMVRALGDQPGVEIVNSINPQRIEGQKTAAFEICDTLGRAPDFHFIPVGNAGNITAYWKGYKEYHADGQVKTLPRMFGWQAAGSAPIVENRVIEKPETVATAIRIGNPASWSQAAAARDESNGVIGSVSDGEILRAYQLIAAREGIFVEPASAASLAGVIKANAAGTIPADSVLTATLTGHGLKDPDAAIGVSDQLMSPVRPSLSAVLEAIQN
ncbi:MAG: threonine synthase [Verrucomicrobiales bacterium]|jgi:threonine synthase|nr:threonine synthase [Verrucomicrobiales bacterium]